MPVSEKNRLKKRGAIMAAVRKCFIRHGFHDAGMAEISRRCGMSAGNLYHYFPSKAALIRAIASEIRERIMPVFQRLADHEDPVEGIVEIIRFSVKEFCHSTDVRLWVEVLAEAQHNRLIREMWLNFDREMRDLLKQLLRRAIQRGQAPAGLDLEAVSIWLVALLDGAVARVSLQPEVAIEQTLTTLAGGIRRCLCGQPAQA
jgi:AcrR family transcriptional regulator